jgi:hypothetical protein
MSAALLAIAVFLLGLAATGLWFGVKRRRKDEVALGVQALANMKWRQCIGLVLEALNREGYVEVVSEPSSGEGNEFLLTHDGQKVLLSYKHGTAYQINGIDVRDFANRLSLKGASRGLLITLGSTNASAKTFAERLAVDVYDGPALWAKLHPYLSESLQADIASRALALSGKSIRVGAGASFAASLLAYVVGNMVFTSSDSDVSANASNFRHADSAAAPHVDDLASKQLDAARKALAEIASLTDQDKARRRAEAAKQISSIMQVQTAVWSAQSTLLVTLSQSDGKDQHLIDEACRVLVGYEELRYSRLQLDPPAGSALPVRWRQCD